MIFGSKKQKTLTYATVMLNAKLQPMHRADLEDAFDDVCKKHGIPAQVDGGGTLMDPSGEVKECDIDIRMEVMSDELIQEIVGIFEAMLAPIGSKITVSGQAPIFFGKHEGLGLYLNGSDLPEEVYRDGDINFVYSECERLLEGEGRIRSYWEGGSETALYMYGHSFAEMARRIQPFIDHYPLCQKARVVRIA